MSECGVVVHSDGSCFPNPGPGAWAAVLEFREGGRCEISGKAHGVTTNNRMEMTAAIEALKAIDGMCLTVEIVTDSEYLQKGATLWRPFWERRKWRGVKNSDLWQEIARLSRLYAIRWTWVRGHADCVENCRADALAENARREKGSVLIWPKPRLASVAQEA